MLAAAAILVTPRLLRGLTVITAVITVVGVCAAVVVLRWHYPTDALGGVCVGVGAVFFLDAVAHVPWVVSNRVRSTRLRSARRALPQDQGATGWV